MLEVDHPIFSERYHLRSSGKEVSIAVHKKALPKERELKRLSYLGRNLEVPRELKFPSGQDAWGFGPVLVFQSTDSDWLIYSADLPPTGLGMPNDNVYATSATLAILFESLNWNEYHTGTSRDQLLKVSLELNREKRFYGANIHVAVGDSLAKWISGNLDNGVKEALIDTMQTAFNKMRKTKVSKEEFKVSFDEPKYIHLDCPGNRTGLDPTEMFSDDPNTGYVLTAHNSDSPVQQLVLLSGVAKLEEIASAEINS